MQRVFNMILLAIALTSVVIGVIALNKEAKIKIAYIDVDEVVNKYAGMLEAKNLYQEKIGKLNKNLDSLKVVYKTKLEGYQKNNSTYSEVKLKDEQGILMQMQQNLQKYAQIIDEQQAQEDQKLTQGVLNQVDAFIKTYGKNKGYDYILGEHGASVLYGKEVYNATNEVLLALNKNYKGK